MLDTNVPVEKLTIVQFTGLHDENCTEIYEGDVIEWTWHHEQVRGVVEWNNKKALFKAGERQENLLSASIVIGNVYENPELLEIK